MSTSPAPADLQQVLDAIGIVTVALDDIDEELGRHVATVLHEVDTRARSASDRAHARAMLVARIAEIAALALTQWAADRPDQAREWLQSQAAIFERDLTELIEQLDAARGRKD